MNKTAYSARGKKPVTFANLTITGRVLIQGLARGDVVRARAVVDVMLGYQSIRRTAEAYGLKRSTLARDVTYTRKTMARIMRSQGVTAAALIAA